MHVRYTLIRSFRHLTGIHSQTEATNSMYIVFLKEMTVIEMIKKVRAVYGTRSFITMFTYATPFDLVLISFPILKPYFHNICFNVILLSKPMSSKWSLEIFWLGFCMHF